MQIIYIGLALLMGVGLVGFGDRRRLRRRRAPQRREQQRRLERRELLEPDQEVQEAHRARSQTTRARGKTWPTRSCTKAGGEEYVSPPGVVTSKGKELFPRSAQFVEQLPRAEPPKPNAELAQRMLTVFGEEGLNEPAEAVQVLQIVVAARPDERCAVRRRSPSTPTRRTTRRVGDLASEKAVSLAPAAAAAAPEDRAQRRSRRTATPARNRHGHGERQDLRRQTGRKRSRRHVTARPTGTSATKTK